ncbi:hypothetical protein M407DRAFT_243428 [Tulasnella calospora MUT 4182]|uniref:Uncharacterized protein n=1 Tax=Tulasnella calospora MUT 4182 TaxID=1051891 RepID=A0A0C3QKX6_9AGAM|nr:hypothetical protein M407DRAFT_243428 [Tulasnella calospora MUT 4182]
MVALLGLNQQSDTRPLGISIAADHQIIDIHVREHEIGSRVFSFLRPRPLRMVKLLGRFFTVVPFCPPIDLAIRGYETQGDLFDLAPWSGCLESLELSQPTRYLRIMEQLAQRTVAPNGNQTETSAARAEDWMCPNLQYITFRVPEMASEPDLYGEALLSLVRTRWSRTDGAPTPAIQPAKFVNIGPESCYKALQDVEVEVKRLVPSAVFYREALRSRYSFR